MKNENRTCSACSRVFHVDHYFCWAIHQAVCKYDSEQAIKSGIHKEWLEKQQARNAEIVKIKRERQMKGK